jgi:hypothetical protein
MTDAAHSKRKSQELDEATVTKLAKQARADVDIVRQLYEEEIEALHNEATVKGFIPVIAARRVRQRLLAARHPAHGTPHK